MLELPSRKEMLAALSRAIESTIFEATYLSDDGAPNIVADKGGLDRHVGPVSILFENGALLCRMYEALMIEAAGDES